MSNGLVLNIGSGLPSVANSLSNTSPSNGDPRTHVVTFNLPEVNAAVRVVSGVSSYWREMSLHERIKTLRHLTGVMSRQSSELAALISHEDNITDEEAYADVGKWIESMELSIALSLTEHSANGSGSSIEGHSSDVRQPIGTVVLAGESALTGEASCGCL
jgi:acyl-CoA reductase-like NAD-dependent aldehyde dehydrogenase